MQAITDADLASALGQLADKLYKPSTATNVGGNQEILWEKCPMQSTQESSVATVTMPTDVTPFAAELQFVTSPATANYAPPPLMTELSASDLQMLLSAAGTQPTVLGPVADTQNTAFVPASLAHSITFIPRKKVIRLVAKRRSSSSTDQSQPCSSSAGQCSISTATRMSTHCPLKFTNFMVNSPAESTSVVANVMALPSNLSTQELVTSCAAEPSQGHLGSSSHNSELSTVQDHGRMVMIGARPQDQVQEMVDGNEAGDCMVLTDAVPEARGQELVDRDEVGSCMVLTDELQFVL